jgi:hypothetical protein
VEAIQLWSDVAEIVSGLGVVVTLAVLVIQVRDSKRAMEENSRLLRSAAFDRGFDQLSQWRGRLIQSPEVARLWLRGGAGEALSEEDAARYAELASDVFNARVGSYSRHLASGNREMADIQLSIVASLCARHPGFRQWFDSLPEMMRGSAYSGIRARLPEGAASSGPAKG